MPLGRSDVRSLVQPVISAVHRVCAAHFPSELVTMPPWAAGCRCSGWVVEISHPSKEG
jgi:hypothetical protein